MADIFMEYSKDDIDQKFSTLATPENISNINSQLADIANEVFIESFDGTTDAEKMNNAITSLTSGGTIRLKSKTYNFDSITFPDGVNIVGTGQTIIQPVNNNATFVIKVGSYSIVRNLTINDNNLTLKAAVQVGDYDREMTGSVYNTLVDNVTVNLTQANNGGIKTGYGKNFRIKNCIVTNTNASLGDFGIVCHGDSDTANINGVIIDGNIVDGFHQGIAMNGTGTRDFVQVINNIVRNCNSVNTDVGITIYHSTMSTIKNNVVYNAYKGIYFTIVTDLNDGGRGNICTGNNVQNCTQIGIYVEQQKNGIISDNTVQGCDIGIYAGASTTYSKIENNGLTFNRIGLMVSNQSVPSPMLTFDNGDLKISSNIIAFNSQYGMQLLGIRGINIIENNDVRANNTSNGSYSGIFIGNDTANNNRPSEQAIVKGNVITNTNNTNVTGTTGYQQGIICTDGMGVLTLKDNHMNNATSELTLSNMTFNMLGNVITSSLSTPYTFTSVTTHIFGNVGLFEGQLIYNGANGITLQNGISSVGTASLPAATSANVGQILKVYRYQDAGGTYHDDTFYVCLHEASGSYGWKALTMA